MQKYQTHRAPQGETCPLCGAWEDEKDDIVCRSWVPPTPTDERMATTNLSPAPGHCTEQESTMNSTRKAIVVGRHTAEVPGFEIIETRAVTFPVTAAECVAVLEGLEQAAAALGAEVVLLQNTPGQVAAALAKQAALAAKAIWGTGGPVPEAVLGWSARWGVIVSVPGARPGKVEMVFPTTDCDAVAAAVAFANPRASAVANGWTVTVQVDGPPMPFQFSHIEWLN